MFKYILIFLLISNSLYPDWTYWQKADPYVITQYNEYLLMKLEGTHLMFRYIDKDGNDIILNGDIGSLNVFFNDVIKSKEESLNYINKALPNLIIYSLGPWGTEFCHKDLLNTYTERLFCQHKYNKDSYMKHSETLNSFTNKYKKHIKERKTTFYNNNNNWKINGSVITVLGGLEIWTIEGDTFPLTIESVSRKVILRSLKHYPEEFK